MWMRDEGTKALRMGGNSEWETKNGQGSGLRFSFAESYMIRLKKRGE